ncbi:hypothetical protein [Roseobacter ponti]|uniref:EF-hand domain-containing protein n=1 Tax=Roseobacter ponti TaxID=1891787 RepID=A0A858SSZ5_9RHOB|nr:hypothetical protein [Roseobacter ponti]QJF50942.1 hypothetical protein G3256_07115 [Roseobacter ponti]
MTTRMTSAFILSLCIAGAAGAATEADANGDGVLTIDEVQAVMPEVTADDFNTMDLNADGALDSAEIEAAQQAGLMPA